MGKENKQEEEEQRGRKSLEARDGEGGSRKTKGFKTKRPILSSICDGRVALVNQELEAGMEIPQPFWLLAIFCLPIPGE